MTNGNTYINKQLKKPAEIRCHSKGLHPITKMNDNKNKARTTAGSIYSCS